MKVTSSNNNRKSRPRRYARLGTGTTLFMNEEYDRNEYNRAGRVSDRHRVYVCWSLDGEREFSSNRCGFYVSRHSALYWIE